MSACQTASPSPRLPIGLPFSTTLEMTLSSGCALLNGSPYGFGPGGSSSPKFLLKAMSCGSDRLCPWKTTTSRSRHAASIVSISACGNDFDTSTPSISAPNGASRFLIDIAIGGLSMLSMWSVILTQLRPEKKACSGAVGCADHASRGVWRGSRAEILAVFGLDLLGRLVLFDRIGGQHLDLREWHAICGLDDIRVEGAEIPLVDEQLLALA